MIIVNEQFPTQFQNQQLPANKKKKLPCLKLQTNVAEDIKEEDTNSVSVSSQKMVDEVFFMKDSSNSNTLNFDDFHQFINYYDVSMKKCGRTHQEDRYTVEMHNSKMNSQDIFFAVFDGHHGEYISNYLKESLYKVITSHKKYDSDIEIAIKEGFDEVDKKILDLQKQNQIKGGSTALCCLLKNSQLFVINCGDSTAVMVGDGKVKKLNQEHTPASQTEIERLKQKKAIILDTNSLPRIDGELAVSRSFGDPTHKQFITSEPEISKYNLQKEDKYLIIATDGFWNSINLDDLPKLLKIWEEKQEKDIKNNINKLSQYLLNEAININTNYKKDNMTLIAIDASYLYSKIQNQQQLQKQHQLQQQNIQFRKL